MAEDFGTGVSRTLSAAGRGFRTVIWQQFNPPLDSELSLVGQVSDDLVRDVSRSKMHSGFLTDPTQAILDFVTNPEFVNHFTLGRPGAAVETTSLWANVNGWVLPITGTATENGDPSNRVDLWPPPASDARIDLAFLEVWLARVAPNPSTLNKPSSSTLWKYGNTKFGGTNITDDLEDPTIGFETTERVQLQYRIRVFGRGAGLGESVSLSVYPDGLDDPNVVAQGTATSPVAGMAWTNMREALGDPGLWRAGNGDADNALGTVDGYSYAIPICAVFRRNTQPFVARTSAGNANQNGALDRHPISGSLTDPAEGTITFTDVTLLSDLAFDTTGDVDVVGLSGSGLDYTGIDWAYTFLMLDDEIIHLTGINSSAGTITINPGTGADQGRGRFATMAVPHAAGSSLRIYTHRPDGRFADEIAPEDILDLRRCVQPGPWDANQLLSHNLNRLLSGKLRTTYKQSGASDTQGTTVVEIDTLNSDGGTPIPNQTETLDGPDGIRMVFSDAVTIQNGITVILKPETASPGVPAEVTDFTAGASSWGIAADFVPAGFQPDGEGWVDGTVIDLWIGGADGASGARKTSRTGDRFMRFASPQECWLNGDVSTTGNRTPFNLRFLGGGGAGTDFDIRNRGAFTDPGADGESATLHPGPMYPLAQFNFERPFIVLGGVVESSLRSIAGSVETAPSEEVVFPGVNFDAADVWYPTGDVSSMDPTLVSNPLLYGRRTLFDMLTNGGRDLTGASSELYVVVRGDTTNPENCGVFKVIGAGTVGYTSVDATASNRVRVSGVQQGWSAFVAETNLTIEMRSQYTHTEDGSGTSGGASAAVVVITDIAGVQGGTTNPWHAASLGSYALTTPRISQAILSTSIVYGPSRGGFARVPDVLDRFAVVDPVTTADFLRRAPSEIDGNFPTQEGAPESEIPFTFQSMETWNRLPGLGLDAPSAPDYGDGRCALTEQRRESELFVDLGSKTVMFRPYRKVAFNFCVRNVSIGTGTLIPDTYPVSGDPVDGAGIFINRIQGVSLPPEIMPRFGRQDIPMVGSVDHPDFLFGINHLFTDSTSTAASVTRIIGGADNVGVAGILPMRVQTGVSSGLDYAVYGAIPGGGTGYQGRLYEDVNIRSSDLPPGLRGIQLPPFLGIARVYGVYDMRDWSGNSAWQSDRATPETGGSPPPNLLRTDVDRQTLYIVKGGGQDITQNAMDHTYVIPSDAIDVELSGSYVAGEGFNDLEYVVECCVFGFARGFIDSNNLVLLRLHDGAGASGIATATMTGVSMVAPVAAPQVECYAATRRTVYQGDPYMTRDGATRVVSDYETRYGTVPVASAFALSSPIQQFSLTGAQIPEIPNARAFEVLASLDFWTTLGTGRMGGRLFPGTTTDIGRLDETEFLRIPASATAARLQAKPRALTEGQPEDSVHASLTIRVLLPATISSMETITIRRGTDSVTLTSDVDFNDSPGNTFYDTAINLVAAINADLTLRNIIGVRASTSPAYDGNVVLTATQPGAFGNEISVELGPVPGDRTPTGFVFLLPRRAADTYRSSFISKSNLIGGVDIPVNAAHRPTAIVPGRYLGMTERLPLGILLSDSDFVGEDPIRDGTGAFGVIPSSGNLSATKEVPQFHGLDYTRIQGTGQIGMADGSILAYTPYDAVSSPGGVKSFRLYRGGGSAYVLDPVATGGPADWLVRGFPPETRPVLKGAILYGRAYLVRNHLETAFVGGNTTTHGDEVQMVIVTKGMVGEGLANTEGYTLHGQISPTGYGEGMAAADRYRLEGNPLWSGSVTEGPDPVVLLAPYPSTDPADNNPC